MSNRKTSRGTKLHQINKWSGPYTPTYTQLQLSLKVFEMMEKTIFLRGVKLCSINAYILYKTIKLKIMKNF